MKNLNILYKLLKYNLKIVFGNKFIWFLLIAFILFLVITVITLVDEAVLDEEDVYNILMFPGILLIFYPTVFCIQNDSDARSLEILFGIPDYRFKVWFVRIIMSFVLVFGLMYILAILSHLALFPINTFEMTYQIMSPLFTMGCLSFMLATVIRNGYGASVVVVLLGLILWISFDEFGRKSWHPFLNPYNAPRNTNPVIWSATVFSNRLYMLGFSIVALFFGLFNLQKREKFV